MSTLPTGQEVDRYVVEHVLGEGGLAVVYRVRHKTLGTPFALKVLRLQGRSLRERLVLEGRAQARLLHPNIVRVLDAFEVDGGPALLMEYIDGPDLDDALGRMRPGVDEVERWFRAIVAGVAHAHAHDIVHRDLKPGNVLLAPGSQGWVPKVTDFGIAKHLSEGDGRTRSGDSMGTPGYMAPEQVTDASTVDRRADIFALGALLYDMLVGRAPFVGKDLRETLNATVEGRYPPLQSFGAPVPGHLERVVEACLQARRELRPSSCEEILRLLDASSPSAAELQPGPASPADLGPGAQVGGYLIEDVIGQGGMATVYRARHARLGTPVAVKVLTVATPRIRERLLQEGRVQAALVHPNIVRVTDVVEVGGSLGLIMEYISGPDLGALIARRRLSVDQADALGRGILAGVAYAHEAGTVHRDLKPANILLAPGGGRLVPKVTDFGLAKILETDGPARTRSSETMGTPAYMAPEQITNARDVDARADVFALGAILYELVSGRRAFPGQHMLAIFNAVAQGAYQPLGDVDGLPERMKRAIEAALVVDVDERVQSVGELLALWTGAEQDAPSTWDDLAEDVGGLSATPSLAELSRRERSEPPSQPRPQERTFSWDSLGEEPPSADAPVAEEAAGTLTPERLWPETTAPDQAPPPPRARVLPVVWAVVAAALVGLGWWALRMGPAEEPGSARPASAEEPPAPLAVEEAVARPTVDEPAAEEPAPEPVQRESPPEPVAEPRPVEPAPELQAAPVAEEPETAPTEAPAQDTPSADAAEPVEDPPPAEEPVEDAAEVGEPPSQLAHLSVSGEVEQVWLQDASGNRPAGDVPAGTYALQVFFGADAVTVGEVTLAAGEHRTLACQARLKKCRLQ